MLDSVQRQSCQLPKKTDEIYDTSNLKIKALKGKYDLYLVFKSGQEGGSKEVATFRYLRFNNWVE